MRRKSGRRGPFARLLRRYKAIPRQLMSRRVSERSRAQRLIALTICVPVMLFCAVRIVLWQAERRKTLRDNAAYAELYASARAATQPAPAATPIPQPTAVPTAAPTSIATEMPAATATPLITESPTPAATSPATEAPTPAATPPATEAPTPAATPLAAETPTPSATPLEYEIAVDATLVPRATPDADTLVYALETPPPIQQYFNALLEMNSETVGFLSIDELLALPVVQRKNDNDYYLNHSFESEESSAGTLFLDGSNLLVPKDQNLIIYGHNMKNGTMFHALIGYDELSFLRKYPLVHFDTIYESTVYAPFAVFSAGVEPDSPGYLNFRRFIFDEDEFDGFIRDLRGLSKFSIPLDVRYGDELLLLVTCEYTRENGRFVIALRAQREGETEDELRQLVCASKLR